VGELFNAAPPHRDPTSSKSAVGDASRRHSTIASCVNHTLQQSRTAQESMSDEFAEGVANGLATAVCFFCSKPI
jgi:hypothetical protein